MLRFLFTPFVQGPQGILSGHRLLFTCLLLAGLVLAVPAVASEPIGSVTEVTGAGRVTRDSETLTAKEDLPIQLKDQVSTGEDAALTILFADETTLTLSESSHASIDSYVYSDKASDLLFKFTKGTFRTVTGGIVKQNPEGFNMETPLASIGIRGSDVYVTVKPESVEVGAIHLGKGHTVEVKTDTQTVHITKSGMRVTVDLSGVISPPSRIVSNTFKPTYIPSNIMGTVPNVRTDPPAHSPPPYP